MQSKNVRILVNLYAGGILCRGITEIAGESASGKTQLCMQLCLTVQLAESMNGLDAGKTAENIKVSSEWFYSNKKY